MLSNKKKIAKNTLLLYFRMLITMLVTLYTVRIVLNTLGTVDYGLYNVTGGLVAMFSILSASMTSATQRYFAYSLGSGDYKELNKLFNLSLWIYLLIGLLILLMAETLGLWFLNNKLKIPDDRRNAVIWVYHFSILSFLITMISIPYNSIIIAYEKMSVYAYIGIFEVILKLIVVKLLLFFNYDKLIMYSFFIFFISFLLTIIYYVYCKINFKVTKFSLIWDKEKFKELLGFSGWNLFGALAGIFNSHGSNILLNIFFGPAVNASRAIAFNINSSLNQFVLNFLTATRPQITKYHANGNSTLMFELVFQSSKFSYFMLLIISMPVFLEADFILKFWLKEIPTYAVVFTKLILINMIIESLSYPLMTLAQATGKIKKYQIIVGSVMLLSLPLSYISFIFGCPSEYIFYISIIITIISLYFRLIMLKKMVSLNISEFLSTVILPALKVSIIVFLVPYIIQQNIYLHGALRFFLISIISISTSLASIFYLGLSKTDRSMLTELIKKKINA